MIKKTKFEETEGDCGYTIKYRTGAGTFTVVKKLGGKFFFKTRLSWTIFCMVCLFPP